MPQEVFILDNTLKHNIAFGVHEKDIDIKNKFSNQIGKLRRFKK